jgi:hypothetical protein
MSGDERCGAVSTPPGYGVCNLPAGHPTGWHRETRDGTLWAEWRGDGNEVLRGIAPVREVVGLDRVEGSAPYARLACGHTVGLPGPFRSASDLPDQLPCPQCEPNSPGSDRGSDPADSATGWSGVVPWPALACALADLAAVDSELEKVGMGDGFKTIMAASRAQDRVQQARELIEEAWRLLGGETGGPAGPNGSTEGGVLDVTGWPAVPSRDRLYAAIEGFKAGAGHYPSRVRLTVFQQTAMTSRPRSQADGRPPEVIAGIPVEVVDG